MQFEAPPVRTAFPQAAAPTLFSRPWIQWFQLLTDRFNALFANPPIVTGSRGGNAALASLLTSLAAQGYIVDKTTI